MPDVHIRSPRSDGRIRRPHFALALPLVLLTASSAAFASCPFGIPPTGAKRLFERVRTIPVAPGYRFEGLSTDSARAVMRWSREGDPCPPVRVGFRNCTPLFGLPELEIEPSPELSVQCPGLAPVLRQLSSEWPARTSVPAEPFPPAAPLQRRIAVAALVLALAALVRVLLRPHAGAASGWRAGGWAAAIVATAAPFVRDPLVALTVELGAAWIVFACLLFDRQLLAADTRRWIVAVLGLAVGSLVLDASLSTGGPGDLRLNLAGIASPELELRWGPAPIALFRLLGFIVGRVRDTDIRACNLVLSATLPILLYALVARLGVGRLPALLAAAVTAAHPLLITFSGVLERQPTYLFAAFGSMLGLVGFLQLGRLDWFAAFVLGTVLAVTTRPEGAHVLIVQLAIVALLGAPRRRLALAAFTLAALAGLAWLYVGYALGVNPPRGESLAGRTPVLWTVLFDANFTPAAWIVAWIVGLGVGFRRRAAWVAAAALLGLDVAWRWTGLYHMFVGHPLQIASARYETILLFPFAIGIALLIHACLAARRWVQVSALAVFGLATAATVIQPTMALLRPFTVDYEYRFLKESAAALPAGSRLYILDAPLDDVGFIDARLVGLFSASPVEFRSWLERDCDDLMGGAPTFVYIGSSCAELIDRENRPLPILEYEGWIADCAAIRARVAGGTWRETDVPARKMSWHALAERTVRLGVYRLADPSICAIGPRLAAGEQR